MCPWLFQFFNIEIHNLGKNDVVVVVLIVVAAMTGIIS